MTKENNSSGEYNERSNLGIILDPEVKVKLGKCFNDEDLHSTLAGKKILSISEVKDLWKELRGGNEHSDNTPRRKVYLHELLADSEIILPNLEIPTRNPELEKRIIKLRNTLAEKEYQKMTQNVNFSSQYKPEDSIGYQMKQMNSGLIAVLQFVVSLACAFFFGFSGVELFVGGLQLAVRLLLGIVIALIVGAAELYFLVVNLAVSEEGFSAARAFPKPKITTDVNAPSKTGTQKEHLKTS